MNHNDTPRVLTIAEAADVFRVSRTTIRRAIRNGRLKSIRLGPQTVRVLLPPPRPAALEEV